MNPFGPRVARSLAHRARRRSALILLVGVVAIAGPLANQPLSIFAGTSSAKPAMPQAFGTPVTPNDASRGNGVNPKAVSWDKHFDSMRSVFLPDRSSSRYAVFRNSDGTETVRLSVDDRMVADGHGGWKALDLNLTYLQDGWLSPRSAVDSPLFAPKTQADLARLNISGGTVNFTRIRARPDKFRITTSFPSTSVGRSTDREQRLTAQTIS